MRLKDYQKRAESALRSYLEDLAELRKKDAKARAIDPDLGFDFAARAWEKARRPDAYQPRKNGLGEPLPAFCLKIPTGGGKTLLAARAIDLVNRHYRRDMRGLVLWIVPTQQIYDQTLRALKDRDHPYRQQLDVSSGQRTLILEKTRVFSPEDVSGNLCVLMLMLPSANRETKEQLRMFRDSGGFQRFFPREDDPKAHAELLAKIPNLDTFEEQPGFWGRQIKTSLGNTLRRLQPLVIMDEGHKAYGRNARQTIEGFNPCLLLELSATPPQEANVLVEISGRELLGEEMIKLDLHLEDSASGNWKDTLLAALQRREELEREAETYRSETNHYIRPICLIQVERTGKDQRGPGVIHAEDAKDYLLRVPGVTPEMIAIKTSQKNELKDVDDAGGLTSPDCPLRFIITKQALQEGWDCSFAYVLAILTNPGSKNALTQLVGRILRQPRAIKTGRKPLDESYVFCFQRKGRELLQDVRKGFEREGLGDLQGRIAVGGTPADLGEQQRFGVREGKGAARKIVLPAFMIRDGDGWRLVHYEADILSRVSWDDVSIDGMDAVTPGEASGVGRRYAIGLEEGILTESDEEQAEDLAVPKLDNRLFAFAASHLLDVIPNPWRGTELARRGFEVVAERHSEEMAAREYVFVLEELRKVLEQERDRLAQSVFRRMLEDDEMRFMLVAEDLGLAPEKWPNRLPTQTTIHAKQKRAVREQDNQSFQMSLFSDLPEDALNGLELSVASYLDDQDPLYFWYRNGARQDYRVQGWKRNRIYADFIFAVSHENGKGKDPFSRVYVLETKGRHLKSNADTHYKRSVFDLCTELAQEKNWNECVPFMKGKTMRFEVVDEDEWQNRLNQILAV